MTETTAVDPQTLARERLGFESAQLSHEGDRARATAFAVDLVRDGAPLDVVRDARRAIDMTITWKGTLELTWQVAGTLHEALIPARRSTRFDVLDAIRAT